MPLISIVIPYYNRKKTIDRAVNSILRQTFQDFEIILVDDNSSPDDSNYVSSLQSEKIHVLKNTRGKGAQGARNTGILNAKGDWIAFLDSDDEWVPDKLSLQVSKINASHESEHLFIHGNCVSSSNGVIGEFQIPLQEGEKPYEKLLRHSGPFFQSMLVSKKSLLAIGLLDEKVPSYQEWDTAIRLAKICNFVHIDQPLFIYHFHEDATISKDRKKQIHGYEYILNKYSEDIKQFAGASSWNFHVKQITKLMMINKNWKEARQMAAKIDSNTLLATFYKLAIALHLNPKHLENRWIQALRSIIKGATH